jgi:hypothetical protein
MNIGKTFSHHPGTITVFTWLWLLGSITTASYFAFWVFPSIVHPAVQIYFQAKDDGEAKTLWPNSKTYRAQHLVNLSDKANLWYTKCSLVASSEVQNCETVNENWLALAPESVDCKDVSGCDQDMYFIPRDVQALLSLQPLKSKDGHSLRPKDPSVVSFSDPAGWGDAGKWPIFFVTLFLAVKLGRAAGEFAFTEYTKS